LLLGDFIVEFGDDDILDEDDAVGDLFDDGFKGCINVALLVLLVLVCSFFDITAAAVGLLAAKQFSLLLLNSTGCFISVGGEGSDLVDCDIVTVAEEEEEEVGSIIVVVLLL
jgi:hypothetical protein